MSRTVRVISTGSLSETEVVNVISNVLLPDGYKQIQKTDSTLWSQGDGLIMKEQCFLAKINNGQCELQSWLNDTMTGESDLTGSFVAVIPKKKMLGFLDTIEQKIAAMVMYYAENSFFDNSKESDEHSCPVCGIEIDEKTLECNLCGYKFNKQKYCPGCQGKVNSADDFCPYCGTALH